MPRGRASPGSRRRAHAAGFTLVEVAVALALLVMIGGLVFPTLAGMIGRASFSEGAARVESVASICRAEAMRRGQVIELVYRRDGRARPYLIGRRGEHAAPEPSDQARDDTQHPEPWPAFLVEELPPGFDVRPAPTGEDDAADEAPPVADEIVIAVFLPSGAASPGESLVVRSRDGREGVLSVNAWTGAVRVSDKPDGAPSPPGDEAPSEPPAAGAEDA